MTPSSRAFPSALGQSLIRELVVYCPYQELGCEAEVPVGNLAAHTKDCQHVLKNCRCGVWARARPGRFCRWDAPGGGGCDGLMCVITPASLL